jgi:hypothetical protein
MTTILLNAETVPPIAPISLHVHLTAILNIDAKEARRRVNRQVIPELGTGLSAQEPELVLVADQIIWRVPIILSLPRIGDLGQVGTVAVDARTGDITINPEAQERMIIHACRLYTGATLQTK